MPARLDSLVIDTPDPHGLAAWWSRALGWSSPRADDADFPEDVRVVPPESEPGVDLVFVRVSEPKLGKNRVHLDLASQSLQDQQAIVDRLERLGARGADIGQRDVPWTVLADPEGNEFCVLDPRDRYRATGCLASVVVEALDPALLARFWAAATGWTLTDSGPHGAALHPTAVPGQPAAAVGPYLEFIPTDQPHTVKNRWHLDVRPQAGQADEVERLTRLGARAAEVGQSTAPAGRVSWVVLADPEGNEFCVLRSAG